MNWKCFNCKVDMEEVDDIAITYNDMDLPGCEATDALIAASLFWTPSS